MLLSKLNKIFSFYKTSTHTIYCIFGIKCKIPKKGNNRLIVVDPDGSRKTVSHIKGCKVKFKGSNAEVIIHRPYKFSNCTVTCYSNTKFEI